MAGALEITAKQVEDLQGAGGAPFRDFMKQLIRVHGYALGFRVCDVISDSETMSDGGCDTEVREGNPQDPTGLCVKPSCWQFKGAEKSSLSDRKLRAEVQKKYARALLEKGYTYCLCVADDLTAQDVAKFRDILQDEIRRNINPSAPTPIVLGSTMLAEWASRYPGFALSRIGKTASLLSIGAWETNATAETRRYVQNPEWQNAKEVLARHVDFSFKSPTVTVRLRGDAGVGKTRLVYEIIKGIPGSDQLCLYTMHENAVTDLAYFLSNVPGMFAIVVADECLNKTRQQLEQILGGCKDRVRVIVVNNTDEQSYQPSPEPELNKLPNEILEQILKENFPATPPEDRRAALDLAEGFVRIAADLCKHGVTQGIGHLTGYVDSRIGDPEKAKTLEAISLFERVGWKDEFAEELTAVAKFMGVSNQQLLESTLAIKNASPGFIVTAGRYLYVTPEAVAQICLQGVGKNGSRQTCADFTLPFRNSLLSLFNCGSARVRQPRSVRNSQLLCKKSPMISESMT